MKPETVAALIEALEYYARGCDASDSVDAVARGDVDLATATENFAEDCGDIARAALTKARAELSPLNEGGEK